MPEMIYSFNGKDIWVEAYPFYANVEKEGVKLFEAA